MFVSNAACIFQVRLVFCPRCNNYCINIPEDEEVYGLYAETSRRESKDDNTFDDYDYSKGYHDPDDYVTRHYGYNAYDDEDNEPTEMEE